MRIRDGLRYRDRARFYGGEIPQVIRLTLNLSTQEFIRLAT